MVLKGKQRSLILIGVRIRCGRITFEVEGVGMSGFSKEKICHWL